MLHAYMDESGIHDGSLVCVIAGFFGGIKRWRSFEQKWKALLRRESVEEFHAKEYWGRDEHGDRVGSYKGWDDVRAKNFLSGLLQIIVDTKIYPVGAGLLMEEWNALSNNERRYLTGGQYRNKRFITSGAPGKPYFLPFQSNILRCASYCDRGVKVDFTFDMNTQFKGYALGLYKEMQKMNLKYRDRLGQLSFLDSRKTVQLQGADLITYETYRYAHNDLVSPNSPMSDVLRHVLKNLRKPHDFVLFDRRGLEIALQHCPPAIKKSFSKSNPSS